MSFRQWSLFICMFAFVANGQASCKVCENITTYKDSAMDNFCRAEFGMCTIHSI